MLVKFRSEMEDRELESITDCMRALFAVEVKRIGGWVVVGYVLSGAYPDDESELKMLFQADVSVAVTIEEVSTIASKLSIQRELRKLQALIQ